MECSHICSWELPDSTLCSHLYVRAGPGNRVVYLNLLYLEGSVCVSGWVEGSVL